MMNQTNISFWEKLKKGIYVALKSFSFIWHHKKLLFFPVLTSCLIVSSIGVYEVVYYQLYHKHITSFFPKKQLKTQKQSQDVTEQTKPRSENNAQFLLFILIMTFVGIFFYTFSNVALSHATTQGFLGAPIHLGASLLQSTKKIPRLLLWTSVVTIIRFIISLLKGKDEKGRSSFLGNLLGAALELAWYIATFLVIPIFAHESIGTFKSIGRSAELMKKTFGENIGATLFFDSLIPMLVIAGIGLIAIIVLIGKALHLTSIIPVIVMAWILFAITCFLSLIVSAATVVFQTAAYHYAIGNPVGPFSDQEIKSSFATKEKP